MNSQVRNGLQKSRFGRLPPELREIVYNNLDLKYPKPIRLGGPSEVLPEFRDMVPAGTVPLDNTIYAMMATCHEIRTEVVAIVLASNEILVAIEAWSGVEDILPQFVMPLEAQFLSSVTLSLEFRTDWNNYKWRFAMEIPEAKKKRAMKEASSFIYGTMKGLSSLAKANPNCILGLRFRWTNRIDSKTYIDFDEGGTWFEAKFETKSLQRLGKQLRRLHDEGREALHHSNHETTEEDRLWAHWRVQTLDDCFEMMLADDNMAVQVPDVLVVEEGASEACTLENLVKTTRIEPWRRHNWGV